MLARRSFSSLPMALRRRSTARRDVMASFWTVRLRLSSLTFAPAGTADEGPEMAISTSSNSISSSSSSSSSLVMVWMTGAGTSSNSTSSSSSSSSSSLEVLFGVALGVLLGGLLGGGRSPGRFLLLGSLSDVSWLRVDDSAVTSDSKSRTTSGTRAFREAAAALVTRFGAPDALRFRPTMVGKEKKMRMTMLLHVIEPKREVMPGMSREHVTWSEKGMTWRNFFVPGVFFPFSTASQASLPTLENNSHLKT